MHYALPPRNMCNPNHQKIRKWAHSCGRTSRRVSATTPAARADVTSRNCEISGVRLGHLFDLQSAVLESLKRLAVMAPDMYDTLHWLVSTGAPRSAIFAEAARGAQRRPATRQ